MVVDPGLAPMRDALTPDRVDIWYCFTSEAQRPELLDRYRACMEPHECRQADRFVFEHDRIQYTVAKALVRTALSRYAPVSPADWRFRKNRYGRPEIDIPRSSLPLRFNLTHTRGFVACGVTLNHDIGVDAENASRGDVGPAVADRYFSLREVRALQALPAESRQRAFFAFWTLKESYIKARGMGLSLPLDRFSFTLEPSQPIAFSCEPEIEDYPDDWQFHQRAIQDYIVAVAVRRSDGTGATFRFQQIIPMADESQ